MARYTIQINYVCSITETVEANDEGEALDKARNKAEEANMNEFTITEEKESRILSTY